ncbi:MAG: ATP-binding protein [Candidatus Nitrosotenuis sp.]
MQIGRPAAPNEIIDRDAEVESILKKLQSRTSYNIAMIGHRRIGKSSILQKVADILSAEKKTVVVYFDLQRRLGDPRTFLASLQGAIFDAYAKKIGRFAKAKIKASNITAAIAEVLSSKKIKGIGLEMKPGSSPEDFTIIPKIEFEDSDVAYAKMFEAVFRTVNAIAENNRVVVILDEFQDILHLKGYKGLRNILDLFRGVIQERHKNVSYVICGSHVHLLRSILSDGKSPLFQHFVEIPVGEMDEKNSILLFNEYLAGRNLKPNNTAAKEAFDLVGGQPYYLMALAEVWEPKSRMYDILVSLLESSVGSLRLYSEYVLAEDVATAQGGPMLRTILGVLAKSDAGIGYTEIAKALKARPPELVPYVNELIRMDLVVKTDSGYAVRDRIIRQYLKLNSS